MNNGGWRNALAGGWDFAWTQTLQSGPPVTITYAGSPHRYIGGNRPNVVLPYSDAVVDDWQIGEHRYPFSAQNRYFDFGASAYPAPFTVGNAGRNILEAPGMRWAQVSLSKEFPIGERMRFIVRWDVDNITKEPQFANPNTVQSNQHRELRHLQRHAWKLFGCWHGAHAPHFRGPLRLVASAATSANALGRQCCVSE